MGVWEINVMRKVEDNKFVIISAIFVLMGIGLIIVTFFFSAMEVDFEKTAAETAAVINGTQTYSGNLPLLIGGALGAFFILIGFLTCFMSLHNRRKYEALKKVLFADGKKIIAKVSDVIQGNVSINERISSKLICEYRDKITKNIYTFESENIWYTHSKLTEEQLSVPVYVDRSDYSKYYVDVNVFLANIAQNGNLIDLAERR
jgi:hypothetical protein